MDINSVRFRNNVGLHENPDGLAFDLLSSLNRNVSVSKGEFNRFVITNVEFDRDSIPFARQFMDFNLEDGFMRLLSIQLMLNIVTDKDSFEMDEETFVFLNSVRYATQKLSIMLYKILYGSDHEWYKKIPPYELCAVSKLAIEGLAFMKKGEVVDTELTQNMREHLNEKMLSYWREISTMFHDTSKTSFLFTEDEVVFLKHEWFSELISTLLNEWTFEMINAINNLFSSHTNTKIVNIIKRLHLQIIENYKKYDLDLISPDFILLSGAKSINDAVEYFKNLFLLDFKDFVDSNGFIPFHFIRVFANDKNPEFKKKLAARSHLEFYGHISFNKENKDFSNTKVTRDSGFDKEFKIFINEKMWNIDKELIKRIKMYDKFE